MGLGCHVLGDRFVQSTGNRLFISGFIQIKGSIMGMSRSLSLSAIICLHFSIHVEVLLAERHSPGPCVHGCRSYRRSITR